MVISFFRVCTKVNGGTERIQPSNNSGNLDVIQRISRAGFIMRQLQTRVQCIQRGCCEP